MPEIATSFEAEIVHDLPDELAALIGRVVVAFAKLEHKLTALTALLLQLNKMPRAAERLDMALDLLAIKDISVETDTAQLRKLVQEVNEERDLIAHSIWLQHPATGELYMRRTRGKWPGHLATEGPVKRVIFPQSEAFGRAECLAALNKILLAMAGVEQLGFELDKAMVTCPSRFRPPMPVVNPLGITERKSRNDK
ncbi:hypothetical protein A4U53_021200 [Rhizobium ruizarguesonis]|uniref:Uncharacterized protein n=2 Tax=Rhizobium TaxID=379 RepID=A0A179BBM3_RHILE|nr:hypothetical protein [Rhizobium leguminosarum]OAP89088.1 hypothetical protein A4U53_33265 [Rhizobium leguminosarum]